MALLDDYHQRLAEHFTELVTTRTEEVNWFGSVVQQVFAIEHGLSEEELEEMRSALRETLSAGRPLGSSVLPLVVVATEVAFEYTGEYWPPLFEAIGVEDTHRWRRRVCDYFQDFADRYNGPRPSGPFAEHFNLIVWPLANAIIAMDLQKHLVHSLKLVIARHDPARPLRLYSPDELGNLIGSQVSADLYAPSRYKKLCQDTELIGTVTLAYVGGHGDDAFSFPDVATMKKITDGLSDTDQSDLKDIQRKERDKSRRWERERRQRRGEGRGGWVQQRTAPLLRVVLKDRAWFAEVQLPDPASLVRLVPLLDGELRNRRLWIAGCDRPVEAGQIFRHRNWNLLKTWPPDGEPLIKLDGVDSEDLIALRLKKHCSLASEPWLFELEDPTSGPERIGKIVRPGGQYLLIRREPIVDPPGWAETVECGTSDVHAYRMDLPKELDPACSNLLKELELEPRVGIGVTPVGLPPAYWEGDGVAEWTLGEPVVLQLSCSGSPASYEVKVDGGFESIRQPWPDGEQTVYVQFKDLAVGEHDVEVSFLFDDQSEWSVSDEFEINIRPEYTGSNTRQALRIHSLSERPSLNDLWLGSTDLEFTGPDGAEVHVTVCFATNDGSAIPEASFKCELPLSAPDWHSRFREEVRTREDLIFTYDEELMEGCSVQIDHSEFGNHRVDFDRFYPPFVWQFISSDERGYGVKLRLADRIDPDGLVGNQYTSLIADRPKENFELVPDIVHRARLGALFEAETESDEITALVPPIEDSEVDAEFFRSSYFDAGHPVWPTYHLVETYQKWVTAEPPPEVPSEKFRQRVCRALLSHMAAVVCGDLWGEVEKKALGDDCSIEDLCELLTNYQGPNSEILAELVERRAELIALPLPQRYAALEVALSRCVGSVERASSVCSLVKLAANPSLFDLDSNELKSAASDAERWPALLRVTRALVLLAYFQGQRTAESDLYRGWEWN